ncbi:MAG: hypothetical protein KIH01_08075 [Candidatus Freyarchaeota archaeon]|nr:hypothetical protein [Candidatus Jordarchaeia archaeon]
MADKLKKFIPEKDFLVISGKQRSATPQIILKWGNFVANIPACIPVEELEKKILGLLNRATTPGLKHQLLNRETTRTLDETRG